MPRLDGLETLARLRRIAPSVPVVLISGYGTMRLDDARAPGDGPDAVLEKPYTADRLFETLQRVMRA
jgi:CheY-like chemotaxis protein